MDETSVIEFGRGVMSIRSREGLEEPFRDSGGISPGLGGLPEKAILEPRSWVLAWLWRGSDGFARKGTVVGRSSMSARSASHISSIAFEVSVESITGLRFGVGTGVRSEDTREIKPGFVVVSRLCVWPQLAGLAKSKQERVLLASG